MIINFRTNNLLVNSTNLINLLAENRLFLSVSMILA